ncbi:tRNA (34-2'-O)-methyltransferase regulator WDR6 [Denticeps clupeoides]|uniref:tRNA (34-2'-O)-methyltransferase regulator WDR6 n=1 Tax=Denticeps clupeoides TaxID=299321 RepID=UPI0010A48B6D|nr:WD repeat-containing protein 6 [Denticeps clupeoides]
MSASDWTAASTWRMAAERSRAAMRSAALVAPVTALEFVGREYLLTGGGPVLSVFSLHFLSGQCASLSVLQNYRIHGIRAEPRGTPGGTTLAVFGGKGLRLVRVTDGGRGLQPAGPLVELQDWVLDVLWFGAGPYALLGVALAHNTVLLLEADSRRIISVSSCQEVCLLYSALLIGSSWTDAVLVGGTVFNHLVLWRPGGRSQPEAAAVERRLLGHSGVIFSLAYLPEAGRLASASDDRSVRVWAVGVLGGGGACGELVQSCLWVLYGHQARVFCVKLTQGGVFSAGEDGACLRWEWDGNGKVGRSFKGHRSGGVRALAVSEEGAWLSTGGADGGVRLWRLGGGDDDKERQEGGGVIDLGFRGQGSPKVLRLVGGQSGGVLVCTDLGGMYLWVGHGWSQVWQGGPEFRSYCVMEVVCVREGVCVCAVGNLGGTVCVFPLSNPSSGVELKAGVGKVHSMQWVWPGRDCDALLLVSGVEGRVYRWHVSVGEEGVGIRVQPLRPFMLPPCQKRWLTAAATLRHTAGRMWLCGDRRGSLLLYGEEAGPGAEPASALEPVCILFGLHGKQGVTSVCERGRVCYSTGRDGCVRELVVSHGNALVEQRVHRAARGLEWLERVVFLQEEDATSPSSDARLALVGFRSVCFVVWDAIKHETLLSVPCGGGHRSWGYAPLTASQHHSQTHCIGGGALAFIKQGAVFVHYTPSPAGSVTMATGHMLREGLHGRGIGCVCRLGNLGQWEVLATGGDDTNVSVLAVQAETGVVRVLSVVTDHLSSVRTLAALPLEADGGGDDSSFSCLLFSAGGRAQLQGYRLRIGWDGEATCQVTQVISHRLDQRWEKQKNRHKTVKMDPETRYMSMGVVHAGKDRVVLALACSDGAVRMFGVCESAGVADPLWESFHHQRCVLSVARLSLQDPSGERCVLGFTAATDGVVCVWDWTAAVEGGSCDGPCFALPVHQSGINSLVVWEEPGDECEDGRLLSLASGGDDGQLAVLLIKVQFPRQQTGGGGLSLQLLSQWTEPLAHSAPLTALRVIGPSLLVSSSPDQRVCVWSVCVSASTLQRRGTMFTHTADVAGLEAWPVEGGGTRVAVCGQGVELLTITDGEKKEDEERIRVLSPVLS